MTETSTPDASHSGKQPLLNRARWFARLNRDASALRQRLQPATATRPASGANGAAEPASKWSEEDVRRLSQRLEEELQQRRRADALRRQTEDRYRSLVENHSDAIFSICDGRIVFANQAYLKLLGATAPSQLLGRNPFDFIHADFHAPIRERMRRMHETGEPVPLMEQKMIRLDGTVVDVEVMAWPYRGNQGIELQVVCHDITGRKRLEEQFRQSQKMEAIGRLAGGVAHDFNNLLTIICGYTNTLLESHAADDPDTPLLAEIQTAGERAAALTRQLLAFSRQQVMNPRVIDLNASISAIENMLTRLIGEDIFLDIQLDPHLDPIKADAAQIEQAIVNLAINARDAMPEGGRLAIRTRNLCVPESGGVAGEGADATEATALGRERSIPGETSPGAANQEETLPSRLAPGDYAVVEVHDTGFGMDAATLARVFEPFFTTKELGRGTGLGLPMTYGIMKQSGGHIEVLSEVGQGATFHLYFPRATEPALVARSREKPVSMPRGSESLMLVEDDDAVREVVSRILRDCGYHVLEAGDGQEALEVLQQYPGPIDLLVSDVVMPHLGGRGLAEQVQRLRPDVRVLFLSGYTDDAVLRQGISEAETAFLQKPFPPAVLATKVRQVLDAHA